MAYTQLEAMVALDRTIRCMQSEMIAAYHMLHVTTYQTLDHTPDHTPDPKPIDLLNFAGGEVQ